MKIKCLLVMPDREVQKVKIPTNYRYLKNLIGGDLSKIKLEENIAMIIINKARIEDFNRIYKNKILMGAFVLVGIKNNKFVSLKKKEIRKYFNIFKLSKHKRKIEAYKEEFLEEYYAKQINLKRKANKENRQKIFGLAA